MPARRGRIDARSTMIDSGQCIDRSASQCPIRIRRRTGADPNNQKSRTEKTDVFLTEDFLLDTDGARRLYHEVAAALPIIDYHAHLPPADIAARKRFRNITELWLGGNNYGDHYKWRLMRASGVPEQLIT